MKKIIASLAAVALLAGCGDPEPTYTGNVQHEYVVHCGKQMSKQLYDKLEATDQLPVCAEETE